MLSVANELIERFSDDVLVLHGDLVAFLRFGPSLEERSAQFRVMLDCINCSSLRLAIPTYSMSHAGRGDRFSREDSPSVIGEFSNWFVRAYWGRRTFDPLFSYILLGAGWPSRFLRPENDFYEPFGDCALIDFFFEANAYIAGCGLPFERVPTEIHRIEKIYGVPYRADKIFYGAHESHEGLVKSVFYCRTNQALLPSNRKLVAALEAKSYLKRWTDSKNLFSFNYVPTDILKKVVLRGLRDDAGFLLS